MKIKHASYFAVLLLVSGLMTSCTGADGTLRGSLSQNLTSDPTRFTWDFTQPTDYIFDSSFIDVSGGQARLKVIDEVFNSSARFNVGTHYDTEFSSGLTLNRATAADRSVLEILPEKASDALLQWRLENHAQDSSGNGVHGTVTNVSFNGRGRLGATAAAFTSPSSRIAFSTTDSTVVAGTFWMRLEDGGGAAEPYILDLPGYSVRARMINGTGPSSYRLDFTAKKTGTHGRWSTDVGTILYRRWIHIAYSYDTNGNQAPDLYINGKKMALTNFVAPVGATIANAGAAYLGNEATSSEAIYGELHQLAIFKSGLSADQVLRTYYRQRETYTGIYESPTIDMGASASWSRFTAKTTLPFLKPLTSVGHPESTAHYPQLNSNLAQGLGAYWSFNNTGSALPTGVAARDVSGNGNDLLFSLGSGSIMDVEGVVAESGLLENGTILRAPDSSSLSPTNNFSIQLWFLASQEPSLYSTLIGKALNGHMNSFIYVVNFVRDGVINEMRLRLLIGDNAGLFDALVAPFPVDNRWHHWVMVTEPSELVIYMDGKEVARGPRTILSFPDTSDQVCVGGLSSGGICESLAATGNIDEVAIWNRNLGADEVKELYRRAKNKVFYQVRSCATRPCDEATEPWLGASGPYSVFSEIQNNSLIDSQGLAVGTVQKEGLDLAYAALPASARPGNNRYFQYRVLMAAGENDLCAGSACLPTVTEVRTHPTARWAAGSPSLQSQTAVPRATLLGVQSTANHSSCVTYQLSNDGMNWKYWDGQVWTPAVGGQSNAAADWTAQVLKLLTGPGFYWRALLSSGAALDQSCELSRVTIDAQ